MSHTLVEIPRSDWPKLRDLYTTRTHKRSASAYNTLQCLIEWRDRSEGECIVRIYALDGDWQQDGTFVAINEEPITFLFFNTISENIERVRTALNILNLKNVPRVMYYGFPERLLDTVKQHCYDEGLTDKEIEPDGGYWYYIEQEKAKNFIIDIPAGYVMRRLESQHTEQVNSVWPHRAPGSVLFVRRMITYSDSVGVFDVASGNLVAWCLRLPIGSLGVLQVMDTHKRMGFGQLVVRYMSKLLAEKDIEVTAPVMFANIVSRSMFEKLGFHVIDKTYWVLRTLVQK